MTAGTSTPIFLPILSSGRHRHPRQGACFMEYASQLAGTDWSDEPDCTHPLLALVAREVNDETTEAGRTGLVPLIPSVIGLTPGDPRVFPAIVTRCLRLVVPVVSQRFQRTLVATVQTAEGLLKHEPVADAGYERTAMFAVAGAIRAVTDFRAPASDALLRQILVAAIEECRTWTPTGTERTEGALSGHR